VPALAVPQPPKPLVLSHDEQPLKKQAEQRVKEQDVKEKSVKKRLLFTPLKTSSPTKQK
jgi:hypothetical protein